MTARRRRRRRRRKSRRVLGLLRWVVFSWFPLCLAVPRSQAQQGPEALPEPEVSEVVPGSRAAENDPSQSLSPCCALWVTKQKPLILLMVYSCHVILKTSIGATGKTCFPNTKTLRTNPSCHHCCSHVSFLPLSFIDVNYGQLSPTHSCSSTCGRVTQSWSTFHCIFRLLLQKISGFVCACVSHSAWGLKCFSEVHSGSTSQVIRLRVCVCVYLLPPEGLFLFFLCFCSFNHAFTMTRFHQPSKGSPFLLNTTSSCGAGPAVRIHLHEFALWRALLVKREFQIRLMRVASPLSVAPADLFFAVFDSVSLNLWLPVLLLCSAMWPLNPPLWASPDALPRDYDVLIYWK